MRTSAEASGRVRRGSREGRRSQKVRAHKRGEEAARQIKDIKVALDVGAELALHQNKGQKWMPAEQQNDRVETSL